MNKIERAIIDRAKRLIFEYATEELERVKSEIEKKTEKTHFDLFNTGLLLDLDKLKTNGIKYAQKTLETRVKKVRKENKNI